MTLSIGRHYISLSSLTNHPTNEGYKVSDKGKGKGNVHPITAHEGPDGEQSYSSTLSLTSVLDGGGWSTPRPGRFTPRERPGILCIGGWVGPRSGRVRKILPPSPPGFDPRTVHPVASRYTD